MIELRLATFEQVIERFVRSASYVAAPEARFQHSLQSSSLNGPTAERSKGTTDCSTFLGGIERQEFTDMLDWCLGRARTTRVNKFVEITE